MDKSAKEMLLNKDCEIIETQWGIWINTNASCEPGHERLCMFDKEQKKIIWQLDNECLELDLEMLKAINKWIEELGWK